MVSVPPQAAEGSSVEEYDLIIDGGTTNTRFTLVERDRVIVRIERNVGAANANKAFDNKPLIQTVKDVLLKLQANHNCIIANVYASGMITSNAGLCEIPHISAPAAIEDLVVNIQTRKLADVSNNALFHFIPGIKFENQGQIGVDMMRGEEVEIFGALKKADVDKSVMFIHFGSHNKLIYYNDRAIQNAVTTIGGELLWAIINNTILKSSIGNIEESFEIMEKYVKMGYIETKKNGISRSLFMARIQQVIEKATEEQVQSYIYGALICVDLLAFSQFLDQKVDKFIIYGRENYLLAFRYCLSFLELKNISTTEIEELSFKESEWLSVRGCQLIRRSLAEKINEEKRDGK